MSKLISNKSKKRGPFTVLKSKRVYSNRWITVRHDTVIKPDGSDGIFGVVTASTGAMILPIDDEGNVWLSKEYRYASAKRKVEISGGVVDKNEEPLAAAKRELREELGIEADDWIYLGEDEPYSSYIIGCNHVFIAKGLRFSSRTLDNGEEIDIVKIPFQEAVEMVMVGIINHTTSALAILKTHHLLNSNDGKFL